MIESDNSEVNNTPKKRKITDPSAYKRNIIKKAILKGEQYVNHKGNEVPAKKPLFSCG